MLIGSERFLTQQDNRPHEREDHGREDAEFDRLCGRRRRARDARRGTAGIYIADRYDEDTADDGDEPDDEKRFGGQDGSAKRNDDGIGKLHHHQDQEHQVEERRAGRDDRSVRPRDHRPQIACRAHRERKGGDEEERTDE